MKNLLKIACVCFAFGGVTNLNAQDFHLSQYDAAALNFNPAMTGMFKGDWRVHGHFRNQWSAVATKPFTTGLVAFDMPVNKFGVGAQIANFRAGAGNFNVFSVLLSGAYDFKLDDNNYHHISVGVQGGFFQKSVNYNLLTFHNQYSPLSGGGFDQGISSGEAFGANSIFVHDINAGFMYYYGKETARVQPFVGGSFFHLSQPDESFFSADNKLPMRWVGNVGAKVNINERIQVLVKSMYMGQTNARELTYAAHLHYYLQNSDAFLIFGPTFRNKDAAVIEGGLKYRNFIYRMSYDINTSSLRGVSNGRGGIELSLTYIKSTYDPNPIKSCPRL